MKLPPVEYRCETCGASFYAQRRDEPLIHYCDGLNVRMWHRLGRALRVKRPT